MTVLREQSRRQNSAYRSGCHKKHLQQFRLRVGLLCRSLGVPRIFIWNLNFPVAEDPTRSLHFAVT
jgi:hypothetical protein